MLSRAVVEPVARLGLLVQPAAERLHGQQLHLDQLVQDLVELGAVRLQLSRRA